MLVRPINLEADYATLEAWWLAHGWPAVPPRLLTTEGFLAEVEGTPVAAGWIYFIDTAPLAWIEWLVTNPAAGPLRSAKALGAVIEAAVASARAQHVFMVFTSCRQKTLRRLYERHGFTSTDQGMTHLIRTFAA